MQVMTEQLAIFNTPSFYLKSITESDVVFIFARKHRLDEVVFHLFKDSTSIQITVNMPTKRKDLYQRCEEIATCIEAMHRLKLESNPKYRLKIITGGFKCTKNFRKYDKRTAENIESVFSILSHYFRYPILMFFFMVWALLYLPNYANFLLGVNVALGISLIINNGLVFSLTCSIEYNTTRSAKKRMIYYGLFICSNLLALIAAKIWLNY